MASSCTRRGSGWILGKILLIKSGEALDRLPRWVEESPSLGVFKERADVVLMHVGRTGGRWMVGLGDLSGLFLP